MWQLLLLLTSDAILFLMQKLAFCNVTVPFAIGLLAGVQTNICRQLFQYRHALDACSQITSDEASANNCIKSSRYIDAA